MDQERERVQADLRGLLQGEVRCDDVFLQMYASDASVFEIRPLGVVRPRGTADVVACVQYAAENRLPIHARGAGTGLAGESLGPGLVIDFSHSMRRILSTGDDRVVLQPGVVHAGLNRHLAREGRTFGPDPATSSVTTMGSVLAIDAAGSHWLKYGSARRHVEKLQLVLADGQVIHAGREALNIAREAISRVAHSAGSSPPPDPLPANSVHANPGRGSFPFSGEGSDPAIGDSQPVRRDLVGRLADLLGRESSVIQRCQPRSLVNRSGYQLADVLTGDHLDLAKLLVGSEGTLALITEATLATQPLPRATGVALLFFDRLDAAARASLEIPALGASACDLMDRRLLRIARESDVRYDVLIPHGAEAMLLVEFCGDDPREVRQKLSDLVTRIQRRKRLAFDARTAQDAEDVELYWRLAHRVVPTLYRLQGTTRPLPFVEDIAVPPAMLPEFLVRMQNVLKKHQVTASVFAHAGHGQLHIRPFLDLADPQHVRTLYSLAAELYDEVLQCEGTISGEHADGLSRTWFVRQQYGPLYDVFRDVKRIFDPQNIFNPGKVVGSDPDVVTRHLRRVSVSTPERGLPTEETLAPIRPDDKHTPTETVPLLLNWSLVEVANSARTCNGCGHCRTQEPDARMCPIFRFAPSEEASPRAKANLMRGVLTGELDASQLTGDSLKSMADLCVHCHQCRLECPANVDIPRLMVEAKGQYVATNGLRLSDAILARLDRLSALGSLIHPLANWSLGNRVMRWLMEKVMGVAQGRKLPRLAKRSFLREAHRRRLTRPTRRQGRKVLYFVDLYANWYDVSLANALVAVMEHNGVAVYVPSQQVPSGMSLLAMGAVERARRLAQQNVQMLAEAVRQGYTIVTTEPAAALCLTKEYPHLLDDDDARRVADHTVEACTYLWRMHQTGQLELDMKPVNTTVGYHLPCHLKALEVGSPGENLLRLVPGLTVRSVERGCSGMAGLYGMKQENYRNSLRAGWGLISALREPEVLVGTTECSSCKIQMEQGTTKPTIHPLKVLALTYGLMPEFARLLSARGEELTVT